MKTLKELFDNLNKKSAVLAEMNYFCCDTCARADLKDRDEKVPHYAYCYFHNQATETAVRTGVLMLSFGVFDKDYKMQFLGLKLCKYFIKHGLEVKWDLSPDKKIEIKLTEKMVEELEELVDDSSDESSDESSDDSLTDSESD